MNRLIPKEKFIAGKIYLIRNQKVMLNADLADLYSVDTKLLLQSVSRNIERFPEDFMFILEKTESDNLRSQIVTSSWGGRRHLPMVYTEQGVSMLSGVLRSPVAIQVNIQIIRVFLKMRKMISSYRVLLEKTESIEANATEQNQHIIRIYEIIRELIEPSYKNRNPLGYRLKKERGRYIIQNS